MTTWFTSDLHFNHDREFIWKARGFSSVEEMNEAIVERFNSMVAPCDFTYILGDVMLGPNLEAGIELLKRLNGGKIIIRGNHDSNRRIDAYRDLGIPVFDALRADFKGYHFYLSHYPTLTANLEKESLRQCTINLFGHTHQKSNFYMDMPFMFNCGVDSHDCYPVSLEQAIKEMKAKEKECKDML